MTKRLASLTVLGAAALAFALPAAPASAGCNFTEPLGECVRDTLSSVAPAVDCIRAGTFVYVCPPAVA